MRAPEVARILTHIGWQPEATESADAAVQAIWAPAGDHRDDQPPPRTRHGTLFVAEAPLRGPPAPRGPRWRPGASTRSSPLMGLIADPRGAPFGAFASALEALLADQAHAAGPETLARADAVITRMRLHHLSCLGATHLEHTLPKPGFVLLLACPTNSAAQRQAMQALARRLWPGRALVVLGAPPSGPEIGCAPGQSPWPLFETAEAICTYDAPSGLEAILSGHRPHVLGTPFYAGWGLTEDHQPLPRRTVELTTQQLVAGALIRAPLWYDPHADRLCEIERTLDILEARLRAWRDDRKGWVISGAYMWKRPHLQAFFGQSHPVRFAKTPEKAQRIAKARGAQVMTWASKQRILGVAGLEDGFVRSRGLGAALVPPLSLVLDDLGAHFDPGHPSRLEQMIAQSPALRPDQEQRVRQLIDRLCHAQLSKYNLPGHLPSLPVRTPDKPHVLVVGQVSDDASIRYGSPGQDNASLLARARQDNPGAVILWKPHPDVEAGLRAGHVPHPERWADLTLHATPIAPLLERIDALWTLTSLAGFEALLRGVPVVTLGAPFYAGWGLTLDLGHVPKRRRGYILSLDRLVHTVLIDYPRYLDPITRTACPVEVVLDRIESPHGPDLSSPLIRAASALRMRMARFRTDRMRKSPGKH